jgi:hypothetical protein
MIGNHPVQAYISKDRIEMRVDTRIQSETSMLCKQQGILIIEVGINSFSDLRIVAVEKKHNYDLPANLSIYTRQE